MYRLPASSRLAHVRAGLSRLFAVGCSLALAASLVPIAPALAEEPPAEGAAPSIEEMLDAGSYLEGEALVVYRADASQPRARTLSAGGPLADAGFAVEESWDFPSANAAVSVMALDGAAGGGEADGDAGATIARVTKVGAGTSELLEELQAVEGVLAVAPNYMHQMVEPPDAQAALPAALSAVASDGSEGPEGSTAASTEAAGAPVISGTEVLSVNGSAPAVTDDPLVGLQWSLANDSASDGKTPADSSVNLAAVYQAAAAGEENIVAVLDTGVDYGNEDLRDAMWVNPGNIPGVPGRPGTHGYDFADGDDDPRPEVLSYVDAHGTHCAGIVAASSGNKTGVSGVAPSTKIMALRIGGGPHSGNINDAIVIACYEYLLHAKLAGENVVAASNSWVDLLSPVTEYAINQAGRAGVLSVFGAGNDGSDLNDVGGKKAYSYYYSDSPYLIAAAATSPLGTYAAYSNYGRTIVDVAAPGTAILSTVPAGTQGYLPAVAKLLDKQAGTPGERSLYYHSLGGLAEEGGVRIELCEDGKPKDAPGRVSVEKGAGLDGREALKINVKNMTNDEYVRVSWRIENPFKGMAPEKAQKVRMAALPGISLSETDAAEASAVSVQPFARADDGTKVTKSQASAILDDSLMLNPIGFESAQLFDLVRSQETLEVGVEARAFSGEPGVGTASFTVTDFGMGFPSADQSYGYMSGTSMACPLVAGAVGALASLYPEASAPDPEAAALELRGRIVGGAKGLHDAASGAFPQHAGNYDAAGRPKCTASNGVLDFAVAAGGSVHPNLWGVREGKDAQDAPAAVLEGYGFERASTLVVDGREVDRGLWEVAAGGMQATVSLPDLLDGARHTVEVSDGARAHTSAFAFPKADQRLAFERVVDLPDASLPDQAGFDSGILIAGADRLFCLDAKGRYLYSYDPEGSGGWEPCTAPSEAGFDLWNFRAHVTAAYADGKLFLLMHYDTDSGDPELPYRANLGMAVYDIASDTWDADMLQWAYQDKDTAGFYFSQVGMATCGGKVYCSVDADPGRAVAAYDPSMGEKEWIDLDKADPDGSFRALGLGWTVPIMAVGDELRFVGFVPTRMDEATGKPLEYALTLGTYDGASFGVMQPGDGAPRFGADENDELEAAARQAVAATGDSLVFTGASASGLGDTYQVNAATGEWTSLGVKAPDGGWRPFPRRASTAGRITCWPRARAMAARPPPRFSGCPTRWGLPRTTIRPARKQPRAAGWRCATAPSRRGPARLQPRFWLRNPAPVRPRRPPPSQPRPRRAGPPGPRRFPMWPWATP